MFLGSYRLGLLFPQPQPSSAAGERGERFLADLRRFLVDKVDQEQIEREAKAAAVAAGHANARWAKLRRQLINLPGRIGNSGSRLDLHLPAAWPWAGAWELRWTRATSPPVPAST